MSGRQKISALSFIAPPIPYLIDVYDDPPDNNVFNRRELWKVPAPDGGTPALVVNPGGGLSNRASVPDPSPNGTKIVYVKLSTPQELKVVNTGGSGDTTILTPGSTVGLPQWSRDGTKILFRHGTGDLVTCDPDGSNDTTIFSTAANITVFSWSRDGNEIVVGLGPGTGGDRIKRMNADGSGATDIVMRSVIALQWGFLSDFLVYMDTGASGEVYTSVVDGTGETALSAFGTNSKSGSRRFLMHDDSACYPVYQTNGPGPWEIYRCPTDAGGMVQTDIWTSGNTTISTGRPHCYPGATTRFYVCAYESVAEDNNAFVSYLEDGTDRRTEDSTDPFNISLGDL